jgi:methylmalonyl-CoA/ethylmalonyl-CoA epimerase
VQIAQHAEDLDRAAAFYHRLIGAPPSGRFDAVGLLFFDLDGVRLLLGPEAPPTTIYLAVADLDATCSSLRAAGVQVESEPHLRFEHVDGALGPAGAAEWHAFVRDSEGNLVGLVEQRLPNAQERPGAGRATPPAPA